MEMIVLLQGYSALTQNRAHITWLLSQPFYCLHPSGFIGKRQLEWSIPLLYSKPTHPPVRQCECMCTCMCVCVMCMCVHMGVSVSVSETYKEAETEQVCVSNKVCCMWKVTAPWSQSGAETILFSLFRALFRSKCHLLVSKACTASQLYPYLILYLTSLAICGPSLDQITVAAHKAGPSDVYLCCGVSGIVINMAVLDTTECDVGRRWKSEKPWLICSVYEVETNHLFIHRSIAHQFLLKEYPQHPYTQQSCSKCDGEVSFTSELAAWPNYFIC